MSNLVVAGTLALLLPLTLALQAADDSFPGLDKAGADLIAKKDYVKAEELYRGALDQARQKGERSWTAEFLRRIGEVHERNQDFKGAFNWYEESLGIRRELGQKPEIARLLVGTGQVKAMVAEYAVAAERFEGGRALYHELGDVLNEANAVGGLAQIADIGRNFEKADALYRAQLGLYEERHHAPGTVATHASWAASFFRRAQYRNVLSEAFAAIDAAGPAVKALSEGDERSDLLRNEANAMEVVANTYQKMVQLSRALEYYRQSLQIRRDLHDPVAAAYSLSNMAPVLISLGRAPEAAPLLEEALSVRRKVGNPIDIASTLMSLGQDYLAQGKPDEARKRYDEALSRAPAGSTGQAVALYQLGNISLDAGRLDEALSFHQRALDIRQKGRNPHDLVRSLCQIALVRERRGEFAQAEASYLQAMNGFEKLSQEVPDPVQLAAFRETAARLYPNYARVLFKENRLNEALLITERSRGQALARMNGASHAGFLTLLTPPERTKWDDATGSLAKTANRFRIAIEQGAPEQERSQANAAWVDAKAELSRTRAEVFSENKQLQSQEAPVQPELQGLQELSQRNPRTIYLQWLAVDNASTLLFSLSSGEAKAYLLPAGTSELRKAVSDWRKALVRPEGRGVKIIPEAGMPVKAEPDLARALYRAALGPMTATLESGAWDHLVAVTDGALLDAPLAALITTGGKRLVELLAVSSAVSFHSLAVERDRHTTASSLLVISDPSEPGRERAVIPSGGLLAPLAQARAEARSIVAEFPGAINLTGADARENQVKSRLGCCSILHFATHGILDPDDGMNSGLLLAAEPADSSEDGVLQAWEIAGMRLNAKLAVLSACDSARGDQRLGEGLVGLAWAFQAAGTPAVVASLWSVDDAATANLMRAFYSGLNSGARTDDAMRQAMLKLHSQTASSSPYFWAAFSVIGQATPIR